MSLRPLSRALCLLLLVATPQLQAEEDPAVPTPHSDERWLAEHQRLCALPARTNARLIMLGDACFAEWPTEAQDVWKRYYADRGAVCLSLANDHTQHVLWRVENGVLDDCQPKLVVIHAGAANVSVESDTPDEIAAGLRAIVDAVRQRLPQTNILILGILPGEHSFGEATRLKAAEVNRLASGIADWQRVHFLDVGSVLASGDSPDSSSLLEDGQLTAEGYGSCAAALDFKIAELLEEPSDDRIVLFDGRSLAGWKAGDEEGQPEGWKVVDGTLTVVAPGTDAQTERLYGDFDFQCEWRVEERGNSGIFYRWADYAGIVSAGPEYQVVDDLGRKLPAELDSSTAATTDMYGPPADKPIRPAGQWNHTRIVAVEGEVENWLNGIHLYSFDMASKDWQRRLNKSKFRRLWPFGRIYEGAFRLQNYNGSPAAYRDLVVRRL